MVSNSCLWSTFSADFTSGTNKKLPGLFSEDMSKQLLQYAPRGGGGLLSYKGLMGTCGPPGYVFQDFCLKQCIGFIIFCPNQGIEFIIFCLKQGLKGQGMRGRATPPHPRIHRVPPPPPEVHVPLFGFYFSRSFGRVWLMFHRVEDWPSHPGEVLVVYPL